MQILNSNVFGPRPLSCYVAKHTFKGITIYNNNFYLDIVMLKIESNYLNLIMTC